ncbi:MAG: RNA polymerase sigma factor [Muricoprocola sp.]
MKKELFTEVYCRYSKLVKKAVVDQTCDQELAEDIVQRVFLKCYQRIDTLEEERLKGWLLWVTKTEIIDYWRRMDKKRQDQSLDMMIQTGENFSEGMSRMDFADRLMKRDFVDTVLENLKEYNAPWYQLVNLVIIDGVKQEDAAERLGISIESLRSQLYRARQYLKRNFKDYKDYLD